MDLLVPWEKKDIQGYRRKVRKETRGSRGRGAHQVRLLNIAQWIVLRLMSGDLLALTETLVNQEKRVLQGNEAFLVPQAFL